MILFTSFALTTVKNSESKIQENINNLNLFIHFPLKLFFNKPYTLYYKFSIFLIFISNIETNSQLMTYLGRMILTYLFN